MGCAKLAKCRLSSGEAAAGDFPCHFPAKTVAGKNFSLLRGAGESINECASL